MLFSECHEITKERTEPNLDVNFIRASRKGEQIRCDMLDREVDAASRGVIEATEYEAREFTTERTPCDVLNTRRHGENRARRNRRVREGGLCLAPCRPETALESR